MTRRQSASIIAILLGLCGFTAEASDLVCTDAKDPNHTYTIDGEQGVYTWDDHGIQRKRELTCLTQNDDTMTCHRWGEADEDGRSVIIYRMLPDGTLIEAGAWILLDVSRVVALPGFVCSR